MSQPLTLTVKEVRNEEAVVTAPHGQTWRVPVSSIHGTPNVGSELKAVFFTPDAHGLKDSGIAHHMINELLNPPRP